MAFAQEWVKGPNSGPRVFTGLEAPTQTYKKGALVLYDLSDNAMKEVPRTAGVPDAAEVAGIALEDASGTTNQVQRFAYIDPADVWSASLASAEGTQVVPTSDHRNVLAGIIKLDATGGTAIEYVVDTGNTSHVQILGIDPRDIALRGGELDETGVTLLVGDRVLFRYLAIVAYADGQQA